MAKPKQSKSSPPALGPEAGPTFGEVVERAGLIEKTSTATRSIIDQFNQGATEHARVSLTVVSCYTCAAAKACCSLITTAYLYEAVPIVVRLKGEGRDTPELRARLQEAAHAMETTRKEAYQRPCVFLGADDRCTIYEDRPSVCGTHLVTSPPAACSDPSIHVIDTIDNPIKDARQPEFEEAFTLFTGLRRIDQRYRGALPRMVLLCLEAWPRRDYIAYLAARALPAAHRYLWATR